MKNPRDDRPLPEPLGEKVKPASPVTPEWKPVPGKPHLYESRDGKYKYNPPRPT